MHFISDVAGATIILDNDTLKGITPLTVKGVTAGEHRVTAVQGPFKGSAVFSLKQDDLARVEIAMKKGRGAIKVFSTPSGAAVLFDGKPSGVTPVKLESLPAGEHTIVIHADNLLTRTIMTVVEIDKITTVETALAPAAYLAITASPRYARVLVNRLQIDAPADSLVEIAPGEVTVSVSASGYETIEDKFIIAPTEKIRRDITLTSRYGILRVKSIPSAADVFLNGQPAGKTQYGNDTVAPGTYAVMVTKPDFDTIADSLVIEKGKVSEKTYTLKYQLCSLYITVTPTGSQVSLDSGTFTSSPYLNDRATAGLHTLRIQKHFYNPVDTSVILKKQERINLSFTLNRSQAYFDSVAGVKLQNKKLWQRSRQITFGILGVALTGVGVYMNSQANGQIKEQNALYDRYLAASSNYDVYKTEHDKFNADIDRTLMYRNVLYGVGGALLVACGVSFVF